MLTIFWVHAMCPFLVRDVELRRGVRTPRRRTDEASGERERREREYERESTKERKKNPSTLLACSRRCCVSLRWDGHYYPPARAHTHVHTRNINTNTYFTSKLSDLERVVRVCKWSMKIKLKSFWVVCTWGNKRSNQQLLHFRHQNWRVSFGSYVLLKFPIFDALHTQQCT